MAWTVDLANLAGTPVAADVAFRTAAATWTLDGPGSAEVSLREPDMTADWVAGQRRILVSPTSGPGFGGWLTHLSRQGRPSNVSYTAGALGLRSILDYRVVHGDFTEDTVAATTIAWNLIDHTQDQANGDVGFTLGTVTGSPPNRTRHFCDGDRIAEAIDELAAMDPGGFDWEIDSGGVFNAWVDGRGTASGETLADSDSLDFAVQTETADLLTYVTALGDADQPCGPPLEIRSSALVSTYGRREDVIDTDSNIVGELDAAADEVLRQRGAARLRVRASWLEGSGPWAWGAVWLGDTLTVSLPAWFGGSQTMRVIEVGISLEPGVGMEFVTYVCEVD